MGEGVECTRTATARYTVSLAEKDRRRRQERNRELEEQREKAEAAQEAAMRRLENAQARGTAPGGRRCSGRFQGGPAVSRFFLFCVVLVLSA